MSDQIVVAGSIHYVTVSQTPGKQPMLRASVRTPDGKWTKVVGFGTSMLKLAGVASGTGVKVSGLVDGQKRLVIQKITPSPEHKSTFERQSAEVIGDFGAASSAGPTADGF